MNGLDKEESFDCTCCATAICTFLSLFLSFLPASLLAEVVWLLVFFYIIELLIIVFFVDAVSLGSPLPSFTHSLTRTSHSWLRCSVKKSQSASATWSRYSCSLVIDIFDSSFSRPISFSLPSVFLLVRITFSSSFNECSDKTSFKPYPPYKNIKYQQPSVCPSTELHSGFTVFQSLNNANRREFRGRKTIHS